MPWIAVLSGHWESRMAADRCEFKKGRWQLVLGQGARVIVQWYPLAGWSTNFGVVMRCGLPGLR